ncbi:MAG TPA: hypothetical protein PK443_04850 [bacterium]|nr:hypothetical protein [bacterium]
MSLFKKRINKVIIPVLILVSSCAHNFGKLVISPKDDAITQILKVRISGPEIEERFAVYTQINRTKKIAILDGVANTGKHIFTLSTDGKHYQLKDHINNKTDFGDISNISELGLISLDEDILFSKLDIKQEQPIVVINKKGDTKIEIRIKEQKELK